MEENLTTSTEVAVVPSPSEVEQYKALLQMGPLGVLLVIILIFAKFRKSFAFDYTALEQSQKILDQRLEGIERKLDFLLECLEDDESKN